MYECVSKKRRQTGIHYGLASRCVVYIAAMPAGSHHSSHAHMATHTHGSTSVLQLSSPAPPTHTHKIVKDAAIPKAAVHPLQLACPDQVQAPAHVNGHDAACVAATLNLLVGDVGAFRNEFDFKLVAKPDCHCQKV